MNKLRTVEFFAGIGGFRRAADQLNIPTVWANDICPYACNVYQDQFGAGELREGDLRDRLDEVPRHDLLTGGFPCQPFSSAGKKQGVADPRGTLFELIVRTLESHSPRYFVLENVKRLLHMDDGAHFATILDSLASLNYTIEWRLINAMDLGLPQNRQRVFITGVKRDGGMDQQNGSRLASADDLKDLPGRIAHNYDDPARWASITDHGSSFPAWGIACDGRFIGYDLEKFSAAMPRVPVKTVLQDTVDPQFDFTEVTLKWLPDNTPVNKFVAGVEILSNQRGGARMGYTIFGVDGVAPTLTCTTSRHYERYKIGERYRRLTNIEYARIQGFPDEHCRAASIYDQYALFGNAVPPPMAKWVVERVVHSDPVGIEEPATLFSRR